MYSYLFLPKQINLFQDINYNSRISFQKKHFILHINFKRHIYITSTQCVRNILFGATYKLIVIFGVVRMLELWCIVSCQTVLN